MAEVRARVEAKYEPDFGPGTNAPRPLARLYPFHLAQAA
jgi:hypothetical protein